ncbi:MAG: site-specific DNA-methyltransferase [Chloroflexi bacterium]|nr:site-specific DNA-methyltransferase [Chloroflexota bacterium]
MPKRKTVDLPLDQVLQGDCVDLLDSWPAECVDLVFADPPYNLQLNQELWRPNQTKVDAVEDAWDQFDDFAAYDEFTRGWLSACRRVLKKTGTLWVIGTYHNIYRVGAIMQDMGFWILNDVLWIKTNPMPNFRGVRFTNAHETLLWVQKERGAKYTFHHHAMKALNEDKQMRNDWTIPICSGKERLKINGKKAHSTQKPEALLYRVLQSSSNPGDVVLDPFFGTGTTGAVAKRLHRHWIGIERESAYVELARERIANIVPGEYDSEIYNTPDPRKRQRIPFGTLLEHDLLKPGQKLFFGKNGLETARVLSDGALKYNGTRGSIHQIGKIIRHAPCNGWVHWFYEDNSTGERLPIDHLREIIREQMA